MVGVKCNQRALDAIERAAFVVCVDDSDESASLESSCRWVCFFFLLLLLSQVCFETQRSRLWCDEAGSRWFDKPLQLIVGNGGLTGLHGEHSHMDGTTTLYALRNALDG